MTELEEDELDLRITRRMAEYAVDTFKHSQNVIFDQHSASYKWLLASLLAVNGAGLLALFDASTMRLEYRLISGSLFYIGIMCALLMAYLNQFSMLAATGPIGEATAHWLHVAETGELDAEGWRAIEIKLGQQKQKSKKVQIIGWLSAVAFSLALATIGYSFADPPAEITLKSAAK